MRKATAVASSLFLALSVQAQNVDMKVVNETIPTYQVGGLRLTLSSSPVGFIRERKATSTRTLFTM